MPIARRDFKRRDRVVLELACREAVLALRSIRRSDAGWTLCGGGLLVAYSVGVAVVDLRAAADMLRGRDPLWWVGVPATCLALGAVGGFALGRMAAKRAHSPFLAALPLSDADRRRLAIVALVPFGACVALLATALAASLAGLVGRPVPAVAASAFAACAAGICVGGARGAERRRDPAARGPTREAGPRGLPLAVVDRPGLAWFGCWAWDAVGGRLRPTSRILLASAAVAVGVVLATGASLARRDAGPAAAAAVIAGVASFMSALRCRPLASPVLRAAPIGFVRAWGRLMRLPALLSAAVFLLPAGAALAAEPSAWRAPISGAACVAALDLLYAAFAATAHASPSRAALLFVTTLAYAAYEATEYGSAVYLAVAGLAAMLLHRARRRFRRG